MLDTVLLCGNTLSDFVHDQPKGPADFMVAQDQWAWLEQQLASSKYDYIFRRFTVNNINQSILSQLSIFFV